MEDERDALEVSPVDGESAGPARLVESRDPAMVYNPRVRQRPQGIIEILGMRDNPRITPWGFWGGALLGGLVVFLVFFAGGTGFRSLGSLGAFSVALLVALAMFKLGRRTSLEEGLLCELDLGRQMVGWPTSLVESSVVVPFEEVQEIVYGMVLYPVSREENASKIQAFTVLVRDGSEQLLPIIEATPNKEEAHGIALFLARILQIPVTYVGLGIQGDRPE